jgi:cellobiose dehydrogenase (acceptor)
LHPFILFFRFFCSLDGLSILLGSAIHSFIIIHINNTLPNIMARSFILSSALFALRAAAQSATPYTDAKTGITFNGYVGPSGYTFGIALPETPSKDFIAQVQAPITEGWAGFSMGQSMVGNLLAIAWPNDGKVMSSFRLAT